MGRMKRRHPKGTNRELRKRRPPGDSDDFLATPFGHIARYGRFIQVSHHASEEQQDVLRQAMLGGREEIQREQESRLQRLREIFSQTDPVDLVARAGLTYLHIDYDTFKEWEEDRSPAHVEYLALQILREERNRRRDFDPVLASELTDEAITLVRQMFDSASMLMIMKGIAESRERPADPAVEYSLRTRMESLGVRGTGYREHLERIARGCLDPFDAECRDLAGFSAAEALLITSAVGDLISNRIESRLRTAAAGRADTLRRLKQARRRKFPGDSGFPDWLLNLPPREARQQVGFMAMTWVFADSRRLALLTAESLAERSGQEPSTCQAFLDAFACPPAMFREEHHSFPGGAHPLTERPILPLPEGYVLPVPSAIFEALRPRLEDILQQESRVWDRYVDTRARYLEQTASSLLAGALPGSRMWTGIRWASVDDDSDLDALVTSDDFTVRAQCKAGRLTAPARRGAPDRMRSDLGKLIREGAEQHRRLATALEREGAEAIGFPAEQARALSSRLQVEAIVCLDDVTVWATEAHELRRIGTLSGERDVPWVVSLPDLMVVVDLLKGAQLVHYLVRRQRLERDGRVSAHDELDWVGHYLTEGLYFDRYFEGDNAPNKFRLLSYTEPIDAWYFTRAGLRNVPSEKPAQQIPPGLAALIHRLESEQPSHWILGSLALLDGDQQSRDMWAEAVGRVRRRLPTTGWSNASQIFDGRLGVTLYVDHRVPWPDIAEAVEDYSQMKLQQTGQPNWISLGEGADGSMFVVLLESDPRVPLAQVFGQPPSQVQPPAQKE